MKIDQLPDGWHILGDDGTTMGPFDSLSAASEYMDLLENRQRLEQPSTQPNPSSEPVRGGIIGRLGQAFSRQMGLGVSHAGHR